MSIDVNVQNDLVIVTESSEDITVNVSNAAGPAGVGVPSGGSTGQVLKKASATNYDTYWAVEGGGVPYSGATGDVNLGEHQLLAGQLTLDTTPTGTAGVGVMRWNDADGTVDLGLKGGNVTLQIGQEQVQRVVNKSGGDLLESAYQVVKVTSAQGQRLAVDLAQGNNDANSADTLGIVTETIANNQEGFITTSGIVRGINTTGALQGETWIDGDILYLSPTTPGAITKVKPTAPNHSVILGYVVYAHANNGKIFVKCENGYESSELHDIYTPTKNNNEGIFWVSANNRYESKSVAQALGYTPLSGSGVTGQVAYWNGTNSQTGSNNLFWDAANSRLGIGTNAPAAAYKLDVVGAIRASTYLLTPAIYSSGSLDFGVAGGTVGMTMVSATRNIKMWSGGSEPADAGQRLQVYGDAFIKGSGATSATTALQVQASDATNILNVRNDGSIQIGSRSATQRPYFAGYTGFGEFGAAQSTLGVVTQFLSTQRPDPAILIKNSANIDFTSNTGNYFVLVANYTPTSGTGVFNNFVITSTINQTGGANGITRGLYVNPTLTAAADWRSIEWSNNTGYGLYGAGTAPSLLNGSLTAASIIKSGGTSSQILAADGSVITAGTNITISGGTISASGGGGSTSPAGSNTQIQYNNSGAFGASAGFVYDDSTGAMTLSKSQNAPTTLSVKNLTAGTNAYSQLELTNDTGYFGIFKVSSSYSAYKIIQPRDAGYYNSNAGGDFAFLNDTVTGKFKWAMGASVTAQMTLTAAGRLLLGTTTEGTETLQVFGSSIVKSTSTFYTKIYNSGNDHIIESVCTGVGAARFNMTSTGGSEILLNSTAFFSFAGGELRTGTVGASIYSFYTNTTERMRLTTAGRLLLGITTESTFLLDVNGTARVQSKLSLSAGTTSNAQINLASSTAPTTPNNGDIWFDGTDLKMRIGGVTKTFTLI